MEAAVQQKSAPGRSAFHDAIARRADRWYAACYRITRDPDLAEDALQDALLSAWNKRDQFESSSRLETWIHRIAINAALQLVRKSRPGTFQQLDMEVADESATPHAIHAHSQLEDHLSEALNRLTEIERVCFVLRHLEQWRIREISAELGTKDGPVKQAIFRAVRKLRVSMTSLRSDADE